MADMVKMVAIANHHGRVESKYVKTKPTIANQKLKHHIQLIKLMNEPWYLASMRFRASALMLSRAITLLSLKTASVLSASHSHATPTVG
jgi:hypothetical protein